MFEKFEEATLKMISFATEDVITSSGNGNDMGDLEQEL